jgi:hypothetical protein
MTKSNISLFSLLLFINFCFSQDELPSLEGKNVLVVYGGYEEHRPEIFAKKITSWLEDQRAVVRLEKDHERIPRFNQSDCLRSGFSWLPRRLRGLL